MTHVTTYVTARRPSSRLLVCFASAKHFYANNHNEHADLMSTLCGNLNSDQFIIFNRHKDIVFETLKLTTLSHKWDISDDPFLNLEVSPTSCTPHDSWAAK